MESLSSCPVHLSHVFIPTPIPGIPFKSRGLVPEDSPDTQTFYISYPVPTHHILPPVPKGADRAEVRVICDVVAHGGAPS